MLKLQFFPRIRRALRQDDVDDLGESTEGRICEAIDAGDTELAKQLVRYSLAERKPVHDLYADSYWDVLTRIARRWGEDAVGEMLREGGYTMMARTWKVFLKMSVKERVDMCTEMFRSHAFSADAKGNGVTVIEDDEKFTIRMDPCGSGGRMRRGDPVDGTPSRLGPPYNFGVTQEAHPWSWGKKDVPYYCAHCALNEILPMEFGGHPLWVTDYNEDASKPCAWLFYKKADAIPVHFYRRVGRDKPASGEGQY
jgi:hypothetical protein